jgi:glucose-1-phosphate adenylyltransferase
MDVRQMMTFHRESRADATVAALPVPRQEARAFGVVGCEADGRIASFLEKPADPPSMPGDPTRAYASMGNYCFSAEALLRALRECADIENLDFGHHVLPRMIAQGRRVYAYDFASNRIPGLAHAGGAGYWRDVGTLDAYFEATLDTLGARPLFDVDRPEWPIRGTGRTWPNARLLRAELRNARIGQGALVRDARVINSVVRRAACIEEGAELDQCVVLDGAKIGKGARLRRTIVDRDTVIAPNACIGFDHAADLARWTVTPAGVTVVANA